jgi:hypothetical protein
VCVCTCIVLDCEESTRVPPVVTLSFRGKSLTGMSSPSSCSDQLTQEFTSASLEQARYMYL